VEQAAEDQAHLKAQFPKSFKDIPSVTSEIESWEEFARVLATIVPHYISELTSLKKSMEGHYLAKKLKAMAQQKAELEKALESARENHKQKDVV
jgi:RNA binding exosome subunit